MKIEDFTKRTFEIYSDAQIMEALSVDLEASLLDEAQVIFLNNLISNKELFPANDTDISSLQGRVVTLWNMEDVKTIFIACLRRCPDKMITYFLGLDEWKKTAQGNTDEACQRIIACFKERSSKLNLRKLQLDVLPGSAFKYLTHLQEFNCNKNQLKALPAEIGNCILLDSLDCSENKIETLPQELGKCLSLTELNANTNKLKDLPAEIGDLINLQGLFCEGNQLISLPPEIGKCTKLSCLTLQSNRLTGLPAEIGSCILLNSLDCSENDIKTLPQELGKCLSLTDLNASYNALTDLPAEANLTNLKTLNLSANQFMALPETLENCKQLKLLLCHTNPLRELPDALQNCSQLEELNCTHCRLSQLPAWIGSLAELEELKVNNNYLLELPETLKNCTKLKKLDCSSNQLLDLPDLRGCKSLHLERLNFSNNFIENLPVYLSIRGFSLGKQEKPSPFVILKYTCTQAALKCLPSPWEKNTNNQHQSSITTWLAKLTTSKEFKSWAFSSYFADTILEILAFAIENEEYRTFLQDYLIHEALSSCVDRAILAVNYLGLQKRILQSKDQSFDALIDLFLGSFAVDLLATAAAEFMKYHPKVDEIEVYLGLLVKLKDALNLPVVINEMNYFACSALKEKDLNQAERMVRDARDNEAKVLAYLCSQKVWTDELRKKFATEIQEHLQTIADAMTALEESDLLKNSSEEYCNKSNLLKNKYDAIEKDFFQRKTQQILKEYHHPSEQSKKRQLTAKD